MVINPQEWGIPLSMRPSIDETKVWHDICTSKHRFDPLMTIAPGRLHCFRLGTCYRQFSFSLASAATR